MLVPKADTASEAFKLKNLNTENDLGGDLVRSIILDMKKQRPSRLRKPHGHPPPGLTDPCPFYPMAIL